MYGMGYGQTGHGMHGACCPQIVAPVAAYGYGQQAGHGVGVGVIAVAILILIALGVIF